MVQISLWDISYIGVFAGTFASFITGFIWFGSLFGEVWDQSSGLLKRDVQRIQSHQQSFMAITLMFDLFCCFSIACFIHFMQAQDIFEVLELVLIIWVGFVVTISLNGFLWEDERFTFYAISVGHKLVSYASMSIVYYLSTQLEHIEHESSPQQPVLD